uniref:Uncharacterized protein n=1 Tax=Rhizophagus irregularis (strain DAOM 181602 / DAOM 197198 / MUCL 43194) TaxID=747089 RepID=U9T617_RHIID
MTSSSFASQVKISSKSSSILLVFLINSSNLIGFLNRLSPEPDVCFQVGQILFFCIECQNMI